MGDWMGRVKSYPEEKIEEYTEGVEFPASKEQIVEHARKQNLPRDVIEQFEKLPDKEYKDLGDVATSAGKEAVGMG